MTDSSDSLASAVGVGVETLQTQNAQQRESWVRLAELAAHATPGPWEVNAFDSGHSKYEMEVSVITADVGDHIAGMDGLTRWNNTTVRNDGYADARFIAAADPSTVAALVAEVVRLEADNEAWRGVNMENITVVRDVQKEAQALRVERDNLREKVEARQRLNDVLRDELAARDSDIQDLSEEINRCDAVMLRDSLAAAVSRGDALARQIESLRERTASEVADAKAGEEYHAEIIQLGDRLAAAEAQVEAIRNPDLDSFAAHLTRTGQTSLGPIPAVRAFISWAAGSTEDTK